MLERQNVELVSLMNISGEEFVYIKQQQPGKVAKTKHSSTLESRCESTGLF